jgi:hypothetical protein
LGLDVQAGLSLGRPYLAAPRCFSEALGARQDLSHGSTYRRRSLSAA